MCTTYDTLYQISLYTLLSLSLPTFITCHFLQAPYGRHIRPGWGPTLPSSLSWFLMESPTLLFSLFLYPLGRHVSSPRSLSLLFIFLLHYFHRTIIYPLRLRRKTTTKFPITISLLAFLFNLLNSFVQIRWVSHYGEYDGDEWFFARFWVGLVLFGAGMAVNVKSDMVLVGLKSESGGGYKIPKGGVFEYVSCANYFGEIVEWLGWAVMSWSWAGFGFFLYTFSNLVPRGMGNHKWYLEKFKDEYPKDRKAVIPFLY